ncbi:MAG: TolC family protein [Deltaproteobacteria bacterium]|nr:TolC family protein [Deltaproteobacteria bacterium]
MTCFHRAKELLCALLFLLTAAGDLIAPLPLVYSEPPDDTQAKESETRAGIGLMQAVQVTLYRQPSVLIQQQEVESSRGNLQAEAGAFDPALTSSFNYQVNAQAPTEFQAQQGIGDLTYTTTKSYIALQTKSRYGFTFGPRVGLNREHGMTDYLFPTSANRGTVAFSVNVPLLKGMGKEAADADEMAAMETLEASTLDLEHTISQSVLNTTQAYWAYLGAVKSLQIFQREEADAKKSFEDTRELVKGDEQPASDLQTFAANLAQKTSQRINAEQRLFEARQNLGLAMGLAYDAIDNLPLPEDPFPDPHGGEMPAVKMNPSALFQESLSKRADFRALKKREAAARILLVAARKDTLPQLDVNAGIGYAGLENGGEVKDYFKSLGDNLTGANYQAGIKFTYPFGNNEAEGRMVQRRSDLTKTFIQTRDLERKINSGILVAVQALWRTLRELRETRTSIVHYTQAVRNEEIKFSMGMASVLDVINMQDRLRNVRLSEVNQMSKFAKAVVQLGYETGTLVVADGDNYRIEMKNLTAPWSVQGNRP